MQTYTYPHSLTHSLARARDKCSNINSEIIATTIATVTIKMWRNKIPVLNIPFDLSLFWCVSAEHTTPHIRFRATVLVMCIFRHSILALVVSTRLPGKIRTCIRNCNCENEKQCRISEIIIWNNKRPLDSRRVANRTKSAIKNAAHKSDITEKRWTTSTTTRHPKRIHSLCVWYVPMCMHCHHVNSIASRIRFKHGKYCKWIWNSWNHYQSHSSEHILKKRIMPPTFLNKRRNVFSECVCVCVCVHNLPAFLFYFSLSPSLSLPSILFLFGNACESKIYCFLSIFSRQTKPSRGEGDGAQQQNPTETKLKVKTNRDSLATLAFIVTGD